VDAARTDEEHLEPGDFFSLELGEERVRFLLLAHPRLDRLAAFVKGVRLLRRRHELRGPLSTFSVCILSDLKRTLRSCGWASGSFSLRTLKLFT
jgi:hypothetical protein